MVLAPDPYTWDGAPLPRGRCSCGLALTASDVATLATSLAHHSARCHGTATVDNPDQAVAR